MKKYQIEVFYEKNLIFEAEADTNETVLDILNCFFFRHDLMYFTVKDDSGKAVPHYYYDKVSDSVVY